MDDDPQSWKKHKPQKLIRTTRVPIQKAAGLAEGERLYRNERMTNSRGQSHDFFADAFDLKENLLKFSETLKKIAEGKGDLSTHFPKLSPLLATELIKIALHGQSEKNKLQALTHLLALGGHNPSQKFQVERVDADTPVASIKAMVEGAKNDLAKHGIEVVDE